MEQMRRGKPWSGRFTEPTDEGVEVFTASIRFDRRLYRYDIEGSIAHAKMLARQGIIAKGEGSSIIKALKEIQGDIEAGRLTFGDSDEDIHMAIERVLIDKIGDAGGKLHTARSRNDQVSLDVRLFMRHEIAEVIALLSGLKATLVETAKMEKGTILPGYTHLQKAQPILLSHYLLAYWEMLDRDEARMRNCLERVNILPLGSAALAGTGLPIDRTYVAKLLKFPAISQNSLDAVSDRDFIAEFIFDASLVMMHLSRFCEDLILWATEEFGFVTISDAFTTGSSIMPQKKNPDVAELIRGRTGRVYGCLVTILTLLKGLPMTYNRDLQEDKEPLFDTVDTVKACLGILREMIGHLTFNRSRMRWDASQGFASATDVAEYLVRKGVPFREAHGIVGKIVAFCLESDKQLSDLTLDEFRRFHDAFGSDVLHCLTVEYAVAVRDLPGGTSGAAVNRRIRQIEGRS